MLDSLNNVGWGGIEADKDAGSVLGANFTSQTLELTTAELQRLFHTNKSWKV